MLSLNGVLERTGFGGLRERIVLGCHGLMLSPASSLYLRVTLCAERASPRVTAQHFGEPARGRGVALFGKSFTFLCVFSFVSLLQRHTHTHQEHRGRTRLWCYVSSQTGDHHSSSGVFPERIPLHGPRIEFTRGATQMSPSPGGR